MVRALDRAAEVGGLGAGRVAVGEIPPARPAGLARQGLTANAAMLRRPPEARRTATLLATTRALQVTAADDALDLFAVLIATKLIGAAERASVQDRLRSLPQPRQASATLPTCAPSIPCSVTPARTCWMGRVSPTSVVGTPSPVGQRERASSRSGPFKILPIAFFGSVSST